MVMARRKQVRDDKNKGISDPNRHHSEISDMVINVVSWKRNMNVS